MRYMLMEAGHVAQNICLQATALDLGSVVIGAFSDKEAADILKLDPEEAPLYIIAVGKP
jgi:SagB-type dehydrogenase family enzyme